MQPTRALNGQRRSESAKSVFGVGDPKVARREISGIDSCLITERLQLLAREK
jgi:hypothetical protein